MPAPIFKISIQADRMKKLRTLTSSAAGVAELQRVMNEQDQYTVGHIMERYLSFPRSGPTTLDGLRAITNRLRGNLRAVPASIIPGGVTGGVSNNVEYARYQELGATIPPHDIVARNKKALRFFGKNGAAVFCKKVHFPGAVLPARAPMQRGIQDRLGEYAKGFSDAIVRLAS